ncbi:MAG: hypothetical protein VB111_06950 [Clostridiaceae bacterium]|nr:hypothetical protein [Clostridiaceae bacterium]
MTKWIPWPSYYDDAPLDLRFVYDDAPAGKHGFVKVDGQALVFEDGAPARFWGTNFNGAANFPETDYAEKVARRLAKIGCNIVRFHQLDSEWHTPNIFQFSKGKRLERTTELDPESMKRLDYLIYCLKREGIYVYMDIFTYRKFKAVDGVENTIALSDAGKPYSGYNRRMIELQKKFAYDFWTHINPYTGLAHKDDPVFVMGEIVNESDLFSRPLTVEPYVSEFRALYDKWLRTKGYTDDAFTCDVNAAEDVHLDAFKMELQERYYREMMTFLREIGVKIPLCGTNWSICGANTKTQLAGDFLDGHVYFYDWQWGKHNCMNRRITEVPDQGFGTLAFNSVLDKPYFISEWDVPWPNAYRAESPLLYAAVGALQGWSGYAIHTYAYMSHLDRMDTLGKETSSGAIGGVAYREGIFSTWNDPAKFGLFYQAALITRRGDVKRADSEVNVNVSNLHRGGSREAFMTLPEKCRVGAKFDGEGIPQDRRVIPETAGEVRADTGELYRSWEKGYGVIDTDRTQAAYGLLTRQGKLTLKAMSVEAGSEFAVIALSSLTDAPIAESDNMLLTTVGRAENTGAKFDGEHMEEYGHAPILAEVIEAKITIKTARRDLRVWAVNAEGMYHGAVPVEYTDDGMVFTVGEQFASVYYLITAE